MSGVRINTGTIPSKTLREAVIDLSGLRQHTIYGESFRPNREIRVEDLLFRAEHVMRAERDVIRAQLQRNGVTVVNGMARFEGAHDVVVDTRVDLLRLHAPNVVIAVGSTPGVPAGLTVDHGTVLTSDDILLCLPFNPSRYSENRVRPFVKVVEPWLRGHPLWSPRHKAEEDRDEAH